MNDVKPDYLQELPIFERLTSAEKGDPMFPFKALFEVFANLRPTLKMKVKLNPGGPDSTIAEIVNKICLVYRSSLDFGNVQLDQQLELIQKNFNINKFKNWSEMMNFGVSNIIGSPLEIDGVLKNVPFAVDFVNGLKEHALLDVKVGYGLNDLYVQATVRNTGLKELYEEFWNALMEANKIKNSDNAGPAEICS